jgi:predicted RNase H-like nuclease (RuvC/YqgF family)
MKKALRTIEQNILINALAEGKTWAEAKKLLPRGIDLRAIDGWQKPLEEAAKAKRVQVTKVEEAAKFKPEDVVAMANEKEALRQKVSSQADTINEMKAEVEKLKAEVTKLTKK